MSVAPASPAFHSPGHRFVLRLADAFRSAGWRPEVEPGGSGGDRGADLVVRRGPLRYAVDVKIARESRRPLVQAMFADAILRARAHAAEQGARPLAIVAAPRFSARGAEEIRDYARRFAGNVAWGFLDEGARAEFHGKGLDAIHVAPAAELHRHDVAARPPVDPFSDLGQWMLKVLLSDHIEAKWLRAPRGGAGNASQLAGMAGVSLPSAARLVSHLRHLGFIESVGGRLRLVRVEALLQSWRAASGGVPLDVKVRWLLPPKDSLAHLERVLANRRDGGRACLGLFAASERLGFRFAHGAPLHVYLEDVSPGSLEALGLVAAREGERFDWIVRRPRFPEAVFRACVVADGVPAADLIQCWLDISHHPARGQEHAEQIWRRIIAPHLIEAGQG